MINYRKICEEFEAHPGFGTAKKYRIFMIMDRLEVIEHEKHEEVFYADNDKWHEYWMAIKREVLTWGTSIEAVKNTASSVYDHGVGCRQLLTHMAPIRYQILGRMQ